MDTITIAITPSGNGQGLIARVKGEAGPEEMFAHDNLTDLLLVVAASRVTDDAAKAKKLRKISEII